MIAGRKILHRSFARVSPVFVALGVAVLCALSGVAAAEGFGTVGNTTVKRQAASMIEMGGAILNYKGPRIPVDQIHGGLAMKKAAKRARR